MKKTRLLALILAVIMLVTGCGASGEDESASPSPTATPAPTPTPRIADMTDKKIGISLPDDDNDWVRSAYAAAIHAFGLTRVNYEAVCARNAAEQKQQLEALRKSCNIIILMPFDTSLSEAAEDIASSDTALILLDRKIITGAAAFVGADNDSIGRQAADFIITALQGAGKVAIIGVPSAGDISTKRIDSFTETLTRQAAAIEISGEYAAESFSEDAGKAVTEKILSLHEEINGIFTIDDSLACGAWEAVKASGREDVRVITGVGGSARITELIRGAPITIATEKYSPLAVVSCIEAALELILSGSIASRTITLPSETIDSGFLNENPDYRGAY